MTKLRILVSALCAVALLAAASAPASAGQPPEIGGCGLDQREILAVTAGGGLTATLFCQNPGFIPSRWGATEVIATSGWKDTQAAFWSGELRGKGGYYRVLTSSPRLFWSGDLENWQPVSPDTSAISRGSALPQVIDWRLFRSFASPEPGVILATKDSGTVYRFEHTGWQTGLDTWGPASTLGTLPKNGLLLGQTDEGYLALDGTQAGTVLRVWHPQTPVRQFEADLEITAPPEIVPGQIVPFRFGKYRTSAFGLTRAGRIALLLPEDCRPSVRRWYVQSSAAGSARLIFPGDFVYNGSGPVEWQCV